MSEGELLLKAIRDNPEADDPRLQYADWLDDNGQCERGEFVRVQVALANIPEPPPEPSVGMRSSVVNQQLGLLMKWKSEWNATYYKLKARERELIDDGKTMWPDAVRLAGLITEHRSYSVQGVRLDEDRWIEWGWSRGFVSRVTCTWEDWFKNGDAILAAEPVEVVTLTTLPLEMKGVWLRRILGNSSALSERWKGVEFIYSPFIADLVRDSMKRINQSTTHTPRNYLNLTEKVQ